MVDDLATRIRTAVTRSAVIWIGAPGGPHQIAWFARASHQDDTCVLISGAGEQSLPLLPDPCEVILRQRDNRTPTGPLLADVELIGTGDPRWADCAADLIAAKQGVPSNDQRRRWRDEATIWAVTPRAQAAVTAAG